MKVTSIQLSVAFIGILSTSPAAAVPWVSRHDMTAAQYTSEFNKWTSEPYNYRQVSICGYEQSGQARYVAVWEDRAGPDWLTHPGMTESQYNSYRDSYAAKDLHPVFISGFGVGNGAYHNAIWEYQPGADVVSEVGMSFSEYISLSGARMAQGYKLVHLWSFNAGAAEYFSAIWRKGDSAQYNIRVRRSATDYQAQFDQFSEADFN